MGREMTMHASLPSSPDVFIRRDGEKIFFQGISLGENRVLMANKNFPSKAGEEAMSTFLVGNNELQGIEYATFGNSRRLLGISGWLKLDDLEPDSWWKVRDATGHFLREQGDHWLGARMAKLQFAWLMGCVSETSWLLNNDIPGRVARVMKGEGFGAAFKDVQGSLEFGYYEPWVLALIGDLTPSQRYQELLNSLVDEGQVQNYLVRERMMKMLSVAVQMWCRLGVNTDEPRSMARAMEQIESAMRPTALASFLCNAGFKLPQ